MEMVALRVMVVVAPDADASGTVALAMTLMVLSASHVAPGLGVIVTVFFDLSAATFIDCDSMVSDCSLPRATRRDVMARSLVPSDM